MVRWGAGEGQDTKAGKVGSCHANELGSQLRIMHKKERFLKHGVMHTHVALKTEL